MVGDCEYRFGFLVRRCGRGVSMVQVKGKRDDDFCCLPAACTFDWGSGVPERRDAKMSSTTGEGIGRPIGSQVGPNSGL
jgi:hypothetical protein